MQEVLVGIREIEIGAKTESALFNTIKSQMGKINKSLIHLELAL